MMTTTAKEPNIRDRTAAKVLCAPFCRFEFIYYHLLIQPCRTLIERSSAIPRGVLIRNSK